MINTGTWTSHAECPGETGLKGPNQDHGILMGMDRTISNTAALHEKNSTQNINIILGSTECVFLYSTTLRATHLICHKINLDF